MSAICACPYTPPGTWLSAASCGYGGGYEPGSMQEWNPDCPVHPAVEDRSLPCIATGETDVDGALLPVACDLWLGHDRSHYDETQIVFWGREHGGVEHHPVPTCLACGERPKAEFGVMCTKCRYSL